MKLLLEALRDFALIPVACLLVGVIFLVYGIPSLFEKPIQTTTNKANKPLR